MAKAGRLPYMQWFVDDWLNDIPLSRCSLPTRAVWVDVLNQMHREGRTGVMAGEPAELARLCRCTPKQLIEAAKDLAAKGAADVQVTKNLVTFVNRRMQRDHEEREKAAERQRKHRQDSPPEKDSHEPVTPPVRQRPEIRESDSQNIRISKHQNSVSQTDVFQTLRKEDLSDVHKLLEAFPAFATAGLIPNSEDGRILFVAAAERARRYGKRSPIGLLRTLIAVGKCKDISDGDLKDAAAAIRTAKRTASAADSLVGNITASFGLNRVTEGTH